MAAPQLRVLFISTSFVVGGAERQFATLIPMLRDRGFAVAAVTLRETGPYFDELANDGIWMRHAPVRSRFDIVGLLGAVRIIGGWPQIVVTQSLDAQVVGHLVARRTGAAHVTVHHLYPHMTFAAHQRWLVRILARSITAVVAVSESQMPHLRTLGFPAERIAVIENGVAEPRLRRLGAEMRADLGLADDAFVALLVAVLRPDKRVHVFVDAVSGAHRGDSRIRGLIAGDGPDRQRLAEIASGSPVTLLGERLDVADLMLASDVICLTSRAEALPLVVLEAMALGKPVVAPGVGGIAEMVVDGTTGILTPVDEGESLVRALTMLADDRSIGERMGSAGYLRYQQQFSSTKMVDRYVELLNLAGRQAGVAIPTTS